MSALEVLIGNSLEHLRARPKGSVRMVVTSPPYWGLRDYSHTCEFETREEAEEWARVLSTYWNEKYGTPFNRYVARKATKRKDRWVGHVSAECRWADGSWCAFGLEPTLAGYIAHTVEIFEEVRRVLADDGTLWLNLGDAYHSNPKGNSGYGTSTLTKQSENAKRGALDEHFSRPRHGSDCDPKRGSAASGQPMRRSAGLKIKDLIGQPWRVAFALQDAGWYLRQEIIWEKNNPMPESAKDRPTRTHEQVFLMSKRPRYFYDYKAILEPCSENTHARMPKVAGHQHGVTGEAHSTTGHNSGPRMPPIGGKKKADGQNRTYSDNTPAFQTVGIGDGERPRKGVPNGLNPKAASIDAGNHLGPRPKQNDSWSENHTGVTLMRNSRSVWRFPTQGYKGSHFATFPEELPKRCILAGSKRGDVVLDLFGGTFTSAIAARMTGRKALMCEQMPSYADQGRERYEAATGLFGVI